MNRKERAINLIEEVDENGEVIIVLINRVYNKRSK